MTPLSYLNHMFITKMFGDDIFNDSFDLRNILLQTAKLVLYFEW